MPSSSVEEIFDFKVSNEEVVVHSSVLRRWDALKVEARVIIVIEIEGVKYKCDKVQTFFLRQEDESHE